MAKLLTKKKKRIIEVMAWPVKHLKIDLLHIILKWRPEFLVLFRFGLVLVLFSLILGQMRRTLKKMLGCWLQLDLRLIF